MRVSIVIPTYGRDQVLVNTVSALLSLEQQSDELILMDQTPSHGVETKAYLERQQASGRLRWVCHQPPSVVGAMNRGLLEARGDVVLFLDDDIIPAPHLIAAHEAAYAGDPGAWAVVGQVLQPEDREASARSQETGDRARRSAEGLSRDLDFRFNGVTPAWVENVIACNLSVRRDRALAIGGFDENFVPPVAYRFETEFAKRVVAAGGKIRFEPRASIRHLREGRGGTRSQGGHLASASPSHSVGAYYYILRCGNGWERVWHIVKRPFREVRTKFHLRHPWFIPVKFIGELRAIWAAWGLFRAGPRLLPTAQDGKG